MYRCDARYCFRLHRGGGKVSGSYGEMYGRQFSFDDIVGFYWPAKGYWGTMYFGRPVTITRLYVWFSFVLPDPVRGVLGLFCTLTNSRDFLFIVISIQVSPALRGCRDSKRPRHGRDDCLRVTGRGRYILLLSFIRQQDDIKGMSGNPKGL